MVGNRARFSQPSMLLIEQRSRDGLQEGAVDEGVLTNREIATLVVFGLGLVWVAFQARGTDSIWPSTRSLLLALLQWKLLAPLLLYVVWVSAVVGGAARIGLWSPDLWKPTALWLLAGFGLLFRISEAITEPGFFRRVLVRTVGVVAVVEYVVNLSSFPLWLEIPTQVLAVLLNLVTVARDDPKLAPARKLANGYLGTLGFSAMAWTAWQVVSEWQEIDLGGLVREFLVPIWLTPPTLAFVYLVAVWAAYEIAFAQMRLGAEGQDNLFRQKLAVVLRAAGRPSVLRLLRSRSWHIGRTSGFRDACRAVGEVIRQERHRVAAEEAQQRRLIENAGRAGVDISGRQLDQREHRETMEVLRTLANRQFRHYRRNCDRYQTSLEVEHLAEREGLPIPSGIRIHADRTGQRWYADRRTITGHWFAIGAAAPPTDQWMYDGPHPPANYPNEAEWDHWMGGDNAPNWD